ncbi:MAG TPA: hypothetical protein VL832_27400 [Puia sp.]|jgi:hypothetical protein|nr:hypothetical protein [Puia sp.]
MKRLLIATTIFLLAAATTQAQSTAVKDLPKEEAIQVKYLGTQDDLVVFNVTYKNSGGSAFSLLVKDQDGSELYRNVYSEKDFNKQFRLPRADRSRLTFVIRNNKESETVKTFEINVNSRYVEDVAVKKLQ